MEGFDEEWRTTSVGQRTVTYTNLDPGTYVFHVRGANIGGRSTQQEARIRVVITPPFWQTVWFRVLSFLVAVGLLFVVVRFIIARREMQLKEQVLESEKEILNLKNEKLEAEVATKNADLMSKAVQMAHKNEILIGIRQQLDAARNAPEVDRARSLRTLVHTIEGEIHGEESWEQFLSYFDQVNQNFMTHILRAHPHLTQNDLRICALSRLNMSTKEMASLLNITIKGVEKSRSRLKKRLGLEVTESLAEYLRRDTFTPHDRIELNDDE